MFGKIISMIISTFVPEDVDLVFAFAVTQPMETNVPGFGTALFHVDMDKGIGCCVVGFERSRRLGMTQFG